MNTSLASLVFIAALGAGGSAFAADPDPHAGHHPATPQAGAAQVPAPPPQTPAAAQPGKDCKAMMGSGMMGGATGSGGAMQGGPMQGGGKPAGGMSGQPMANGMMDHCMKPATGGKGAAQTPPKGPQ